MRQRPPAGDAGTGGFRPAHSRCRNEQVEQRLAFDVGILCDGMRVEDSIPIRLLGIVAALVIDFHRIMIIVMQRAGMVIERDGMQSADMTAIARMRVTGRSRGHAETREGQRKTS